MSEIGVKPGEFPYPLVDGPAEPRYLTWVRNHSNYLARRGFLDYVRIVAVLVRGVLVNFLTLLPWILAAALVLSLFYAPLLADWESEEGWFLTADAYSPSLAKWGQDHLGTRPPFVLTPWVAAAALTWFLLFPMVTRLFKAATHKKSLETGSESSVKLRDRYERSFGGALIVLAGVAVIESVPLWIHYFHAARQLDLRGIVAALAGGTSLAALAGAGKVLSFVSKARRKLVIGSLALLGIVLPLLVVLYVTEFLIYDNQRFDLKWWYLAVMPAALALGLLLALFLGRRRGALERQGWLWGILAAVVLAVAGLFLLRNLFPNLAGFFVFALAVEIWIFSWLAVDVNLTSVHGFYRDRLAAAFLVGEDVRGDVDIEEDVDLHEICQYENGSTAPYHLVNVALNLQGSKDIGIRERHSDFFIFSKKFIGSERTGYCRSETLETVFPQMDLATAMAISAAAASPNMGVGTQAPLVALLTIFNVRLGYWIPNPGRLEPGISFAQVFGEELAEIERRWAEAYLGRSERRRAEASGPTHEHGLVGLAFSGGGIRSASLNLGIAQALHQRGVFDHVDYLSTVSGGGYLGSSLSTLMRKKSPGPPPHAGKRGTLRQRFSWRVRPSAFLREMASRLDEKHRWVNLSDGGHIENMAAVELLRRRCKYVLIGDGEADPQLTFHGLATLIRYARIDLGARIEIDLDDLRLDDERKSRRHVAAGTIHYPGEEEPGCLLYFKSSFTGDEDEVIQEYRACEPTFPHQTTADQFFDEVQFEAYRALGQHIAEGALESSTAEKLSYADLAPWFETLRGDTGLGGER